MSAGERQPEPAGLLPSFTSLPAAGPARLATARADWVGFFDAHYHRVVRFVMLGGACLEEAQDAAQEAFAESWALMTADLARWQAVTNPAAWIRVVALRKYRRPPGPRKRPLLYAGCEIPDQPHPGPGPEELTVQAQLVRDTLRSLDDEARAVMAFSLDGFSASDIAGAVGITEQRARDVRKKARAVLKRELARHMTPEGGISSGRR
jgi:RNA polymerase sigma-70 factor (ECF subfamily)